VAEILVAIDREIAQLQQARALLNGGSGSKGRTSAFGIKAFARKKRRLTPDGRRRIAEAVKRRWAEQKKAASK
jgi:hypothetical protein